MALETKLVLYLTSTTALHLHCVLGCLLCVKSFVSLIWGKSWICEYLSYGGNFLFKMSFHGISSSALSSLLQWSMWVISLTRQPRSGRRNDGTLELLSVGTCVLCVQAIFWHRKTAYQSLLSALHACFYFQVSLGHYRDLFLSVFHPDDLCSIYFLSFSLWGLYKS